MKKLWIIAAVLLLTGCAAPKDYETMADNYLVPQQIAKQVSASVPSDDALLAMTDAGGGTLYLCDGYSVLIETLEAGDIDRTLKHISGFTRDQLQVIERQDDIFRRLECVWAAAGEGQDQVGRAVILDDGAYHYTLTFMADAQKTGELTQQWQQIVQSFNLDTAQ